jgi:predicted DNA-binding helix-hairpin-helix protein
MSPKFGLQEFDPNAPPPPVEQCDVLKPEQLAEYRKKRAEWLSWYQFRKDEPNNIEGQIIRMTFLDMSYRMMTKPRSDIPQDVNIAARNGLLAHM